MIYRCAHCYKDLGPVNEDEPAPSCPDHPSGSIERMPDEVEHDAPSD